MPAGGVIKFYDGDNDDMKSDHKPSNTITGSTGTDAP